MPYSSLGLIGMGGALLRPGGNLGEGFLAYGDGAVKDSRLQSEAVYRQAQIGSLQAAEEERRLKTEIARQQREADAAFAATFGVAPPPQQAPAGMQAAPQSGLNVNPGAAPDPVQAMAAKIPGAPGAEKSPPAAAWSDNRVRLALLAGYKPEAIKLMAEGGDLGMAKVARTVDGTDELGRPTTLQFDDQGRQVGSPIAKAYAKSATDTGGSIQPFDPYMASFVGNSMKKTNSPDSILSSQTSIRGQNLTDARAREFNATARAQAAATADGVKAQREATNANTQLDNVRNMRTEFAALPEVKEFKAIIPAQNSATDALKRDTAQADINLVYAVAKVFDPTSVVREGEYATVSSSAPPAERYKGLVNHLLGGGKLTDQTRRALLAEINSRASSGQASYNAARTSFTDIAKRNNIKPEDIFTELPSLAETPAPTTAAPAASGGWSIRKVD